MYVWYGNCCSTLITKIKWDTCISRFFQIFSIFWCVEFRVLRKIMPSASEELESTTEWQTGSKFGKVNLEKNNKNSFKL